MKPGKPSRAFEIASDMVEGELSDSAHAELLALLKRDPDSRRSFAESLAFHGLLERVVAEELSRLD